MRLEFETPSFITLAGVEDWFQSNGFTVYEVERSRLFGSECRNAYRFSLTLREEAGERALRELQGRVMGGVAITLLCDSEAFAV